MNKNLSSQEKALLKKSQKGATISFILLFLPIAVILIFHTSNSLAKWLGVVGIIMILPALYFMWQILKIAYKDQKNEPHPSLWVPKVYGFGISVNPYHPLGKVIYLFLALLIGVIAIKMIFTPVALLNH